MKLELGTITEMLSLVTTVVARAPIEITSPSTSPTSIRSPALIGRSNRMITPLMKLLAMFCSPKPTPMPTAPARMLNAVRSIPAVWRMTKNPRTMIR